MIRVLCNRCNPFPPMMDTFQNMATRPALDAVSRDYPDAGLAGFVNPDEMTSIVTIIPSTAEIAPARNTEE